MRRCNKVHSISALLLILLLVGTTHGVAQAPFSGRVVDSSDQPIQGAIVFLAEAHLIRSGSRVVERTESDADGRFSLPVAEDKRLVGVIYKPGFGVSLTSFRDGSIWKGFYRAESTQVDYELTQGKTLSINVNDSQNNPAKIVAANVSLLEVKNGENWGFGNSSELPLPVQIQGNTLSVDWLSEDIGLQIHVETENDIAQDIYVPFEAEIPESIQLVGSSALSGDVSLATTGKEIPPEARVSVNVVNPPYGSNQPKLVRRVFQDSVDLDSKGKYQLTAIAGSAQVTLFDGRSKWGADSKALLLELGKSHTQDLKMHELWTIRGRCVDEQGQPIKDVLISAEAVSDENGEFELIRPQNQTHYTITTVPAGFLDPFEKWKHFKPEKDVTEYQIPDIVLRKAMTFSGRVMDPDGNPAANTNVYAVWQAKNGRSATSKAQSVKTDEQGNFTFTKADKFDIRLTADNEQMASRSAEIVTVNNREDVTLTVSPEGKLNFVGTITDLNGKPVSDATIKLSQHVVVPGTDHSYGHRVMLRNQAIKTDSTGRFEYPIKLRRSERYKLNVDAKGYVGQEVTALEIPAVGDLDLTHVKLKATRSARGIVVDTSGKPIAGVRVWSHGISAPNQHERSRFRQQLDSGIAADSDEEGQFEITGIHGDAHFVFAAKDGYRMTGVSLADSGQLRIELPKYDEPGQPLEFKRVDEVTKRKQLRRLLEFVRSVSGEPSRYQLSQELDFNLAVDIDLLNRSIAGLEFGYNKAPWLAAAGYHEDAFETCLAMSTPYWRVSALTACADRTNKPEHKSALLKEAGFRLKNLADMRRRVEMASSIIDGLIDLGHYEAARDVADYVTPIALDMNLEGRNEFSKAWYAKALARLDYDMAWELIKNSRDTGNRSSGGFARHAGNMAHELAASDPDKAIGLVNEIPEPSRARYMQRVATRMAPVDADRAIALMDSCKVNSSNATQVANGYGSIAMQLSESSPTQARQLLQQGFDHLFSSTSVLADRFNFGYPINLLRFESKIRTQGSPNFWRVIEATSDPNLTGYWGSDRQREVILRRARPALVLELFGREPEASARLLEPVFKYFEDPPVENKNWSQQLTDHAPVFVAMALHDPDRTVSMHESLYNKIPERQRSYIPMPWVVIARTIASEPDALVDYLAELSYTWIIGKED